MPHHRSRRVSHRHSGPDNDFLAAFYLEPHSYRSNDGGNITRMRQADDRDALRDKTTWVVCDRIPAGRITDDNHPTPNTFLTDSVLKAVVESSISPYHRSTWWSDDFDSTGKVRVSRQCRGDPVYDPHTGEVVVLRGSAVHHKYRLSGNPQWHNMHLSRAPAAREPELRGDATPISRKQFYLTIAP